MRSILLGLILATASTMAIEVGSVPVGVEISGENGGKLDGSAWHSSMLKGKLYALFYVDPDEKDLNDDFANALKARKLDRKKAATVAIVNLKATWLPDMVIESKLKEKQKRFPNTLYVKDKKKVLVNMGQMEDDNSDILIFDKEGKLIYKKFGKMSAKEIKEAMTLIDNNL
ncbi:MAG: transcriptional regulator [Sulfurovum sp.]|nr:transcriptional regulator [Sulfurovum sp.]